MEQRHQDEAVTEAAPVAKRRKLERSDTILSPSEMDMTVSAHAEARRDSDRRSHVVGGTPISTTDPFSIAIANELRLPDSIVSIIVGLLDIATFARLTLVDSTFQLKLWPLLTHFDDTRYFVLSRLLTASHYEAIPFSSLHYLSLSKSRFAVTDDSLQLIGSRLTNLRSLDLSWCHTITHHGFKYLTSLTKLESLSVRGCANLNCSGFQPAVGMLTNLKELDISHCLKFDALYEDDLGNLTQLTRLEIERCPLMANMAMVDSLLHFTKLRVLNLSGSIQLSGFLLPVISRACPSLEVLDISYCPTMSEPPDALRSLLQLKSLRVLDVGGCLDNRGPVARSLLPHVRVFD